MKYRFLDELTIVPYSGTPLKVFEGQDCIKYVANPTEEQLTEFGYKDLEDTAEIPDEQEGFITQRYYVDGDVITAAYRQVEAPVNDILIDLDIPLPEDTVATDESDAPDITQM